MKSPARSGSTGRAAAAPGAAEAAALPDPADIQHELRPEATRLFVGAPEAACSPVRGRVACAGRGRAAAAVREPALHGCRALLQGLRAWAVPRAPTSRSTRCGLSWNCWSIWPCARRPTLMDAAAEDDLAAGGDGAPTEEQAEQYKEIGDEIDEFDAEDDGPEPGDVVASGDLPGGSPEAAWDEFLTDHAKVWMPQLRRGAARRIPACRSTSRPPACSPPSSINGDAVARIGQFRGGSLCGLPSFCARASWGG